jgi:hypothetical protein
MKLKKKEDHSVDILWSFLEKGDQNTHGRRYKVWSRHWRKGHPVIVPPGDPSHIQFPNPDTIVDANKCLLTGAWYCCLLRGSATVWQIQKWMLTAIHWTEHGVPNEGARERTQGAEGVCSPIGGSSILTNQCPHSSLGLNHQSKKKHDGTCVSSCTCNRGCTSWLSMGGEALGPVKVLCPSIGECQDWKWEWVGWEAGSWGGDRWFLERNLRKGITFEI